VLRFCTGIRTYWITSELHNGTRVIHVRASAAAVTDRNESMTLTSPNDPLTVAYTRMRLYDVSQLPVLEETGRLAGIIDESDLLFAAHRGNNPRDASGAFDRPIREVMTTRVKTIDHRANIDDLFPILDAGMVAVVNDAEGFHGLITRVDVLNYLRTQQNARKQPPKETMPKK